MKVYTVEELEFKVGDNKKENWLLLRESGWLFHLSSFPSCYVIAVFKDSNLVRNLTKEEIEYGARLCLSHTKYKNLRNIKIDYSLVENVRKGQKEGEIYFKNRKKVFTVSL